MLSLVFLVIICLFAFITGTFLVETMSIANRLENKDIYRDSWAIINRIEVGQLGERFFNFPSQILAYCCLILYTLGCLAAYAVMFASKQCLGVNVLWRPRFMLFAVY